MKKLFGIAALLSLFLLAGCGSTPSSSSSSNLGTPPKNATPSGPSRPATSKEIKINGVTDGDATVQATISNM
ncbi:MAG: hypothetical protein LBO09_08295 [Candidatus Peribacteria bacterium]|nr:hypothetical protein [Candidatus Peribacteria bacterium]